MWSVLLRIVVALPTLISATKQLISVVGQVVAVFKKQEVLEKKGDAAKDDTSGTFTG